MPFLELQNITKRFGDFTAVADLDLTVEQGEFISLLGPSGCGKTTTLQMIAGFVEPSAGQVVLDGRSLTGIKPNQRGLGIVFQSYALFPHMTVSENVSFGLEMRKVARAERRQRVQEVLELVHLDAFAERYPRQLSGGQRQRVALARALVIRPPILLLDEPLSNLDAKLREDMQLELRAIQRTLGTTTLLVTHDQSEALSMSDRIVVMNQGRAIQIDAPYQTYEHPQTAFVSDFLGKANLFAGNITRRNDALICRVGDTEIMLNNIEAPEGGPVRLSIRPEKLELTSVADGLLRGRISNRLFLGNHWLYQVNSPLGDLLVTAANSGHDALNEHNEVGIRWQPEALRVLPADDARG